MSTPVIHIAGSKGKGTTAHLIAHFLKAVGKKVGLFTSPFLLIHEEMIQVNGQAISKEDFARLTQEVLQKEPSLSEFEMWTKAAFRYFDEQACDYAVLECGWGGARDATNWAENKVLTILTHVELEHVGVLGDNLKEIAQEKLGICRPGVPLLTVASQAPEVFEAIEEKNIEWIITGENDLGYHHPESAGLAIAALDYLGYALNDEILDAAEGLQIPGRFEVLEYGPHTLILDGAHTLDSVKYVQERIFDYSQQHEMGEPFWALHFLKDKPAELADHFIRARSNWILLDDERAGQCPDDMTAITTEELLEKLDAEKDAQLLGVVGSFKLVAAVKKVLEKV